MKAVFFDLDGTLTDSGEGIINCAILALEHFGLPIPTDSYSVWDLNEEFTVNPDDFLSLGKATPFEGHRLFGVNKLTCHRGKTVYKVN
jgi:dihydroorotase